MSAAGHGAPLQSGFVLPAVVTGVLLALPPLLTPYAQALVERIAIHAVYALSLQLLVGMTGLVSLGHAAFFGIGAYAAVLASGDAGGSLPGVAALAMGAAGAYALFVGALSLRTRGVYFIMVTLAFAQMAFFVVHDTRLAGGSDGLFLYVKPVLAFGGKTWLDLDDRRHAYAVVIVCLALAWFGLAFVARSRFGHALGGIRVNEARMRAAGYATTAYKLAAFVAAGALAGLAGCLLAIKDGAVNPELLGWQASGAVLLMVILGGLGSLHGAVVGAAAFTLLEELLQSQAWLGAAAAHWQLTLGIVIIAFVAWLPDGLIGLGAWRTRGAARGQSPGRQAVDADPRRPGTAGAGDDRPAAASADRPLLSARSLTRRFGGLTAVDAVSIDLAPGEVHAVIGTNGAGKSTLVALLSGELAPTSGSIALGGADVGRWSQPRRARAGLGRSHQRTSIFPGFSVLENCRLCAQSVRPRPGALWQAAQRCEASLDRARQALAAAGLAGVAERPAGTLSHGAQRQLEIAMCLATGPRVLLLDEPLAGMGAEESGQMLELLDGLRRDHAVLLIEHDMDAVFRIADRITVMVNGEVVASGRPAQIRADPLVRTAYLGEEA